MKKNVFISILFALNAGSVFPQDKYTDFHTHLTFKHYYKDIPDPKILIKDLQNQQSILAQYGRLNWKHFDPPPLSKYKFDKADGNESNFKNYYQTNYSELGNVKGSILCNSFYPWEKGRTLSYLNRVIDNQGVSKLFLKRLRTVSRNDNSPFEEFMGEYLFAANQVTTQNGNTVIFAKNNKELQENIKNNVTSAVMTIEGAQVFSGRKSGSRENVNDYHDKNGELAQEIMDNVCEVKNLPHHLFFVTVGHFSWNRVAGYAKTLDKFGMRRKIISFLSYSEKVRGSLFYKPGAGLHGPVGLHKGTILIPGKSPSEPGYWVPIRVNPDTILDLGKKVITELLNPATSIHKKATFIDVKHMDVLARMQYYDLRKSLETAYDIKIPVIASHTAVSGENLGVARATGLYPNFDKYREIRNPKRYYRKESKLDATWRHHVGYNPYNTFDRQNAGWFYPWSVNLYDEEISIIHESDGIMGLMLDGRLLGQSMNKYTSSYKHSIKKKFLEYVKDKPYAYKNFDEFYEVIPFMRNMLYIASHCGKEVCWDHISMGSDFDGLIHPLQICPTAKEIPVFKKKLNDYLDVYIKITEQQSFTESIGVSKILDKMFYENGAKFITTYF